MLKVTWLKEKGGLNQALSSGVEFCWITEDNFQCSPFAYCKDYLQDSIQGFLFQQKNSIYGFTYDPELKKDPSIDKLRILVANANDKQFRDKLPGAMDFVNQIGKVLLIPPIKVEECEAPPLKYTLGGAWIVEGSVRWIKSPVMLSLFSLLFRIGLGHAAGTPYNNTIQQIIDGKVTTYQPADRGRLISAKVGIDRILKYGDRKIFHADIKENYSKSVDISTMHNNMGIVGFSQSYTKKLMPHWYREIA